MLPVERYSTGHPIKRVQVPRLGEIFCKAWEQDLNISSIPDLLGVSRPTFYKVLDEYTRKLGMEIRYVPNVYALGYRIAVIEGSVSDAGAGVLAFNLGGLKTVKTVYVKHDMTGELIELMENMGMRVRGPLVVSKVYCNTASFSPERYSMARLSSDERIVAYELTERLGNIKEMAKKLGISWQRATSAFRGLRNKGALVAPVYYKNSKSSDHVGVLIEVDRIPSRRDIQPLLDGASAIVLTGEREKPPYMIAAVAKVGNVLSLIEDSINGKLGINILQVYMSRSHPLPPMKGNNIITLQKPDKHGVERLPIPSVAYARKTRASH